MTDHGKLGNCCLDTESEEEEDCCLLPDRAHLGRQVGTSAKKEGHWYLDQEGEEEGETDGSDLEGYEEVRKHRPSIDMNSFMDNSSIQLKSLNPISKPKGAHKMVKIPSIVEDLVDKSKLGQDTDGEGKDEDEDSLASVPTEDEQMEVNLADFKFILNEERLMRGQNELELKSYQSYISTKSKVSSSKAKKAKSTSKLSVENNTDLTSEGELSDLVFTTTSRKRKTKKKKVSSEKKDENCDSGNDSSTDASDIEVSMKDYYAIRHDTDIDLSERRLSLTEAIKAIHFNPNSKFDPRDYGLSGGLAEDEDPCTDEDSCDSNSSREKDTIEEEDDADKTHMSDLEVNVKDYYQIRMQTTPKDDNGMNEFILEMNPVESLIKMESTEANLASSEADTEDEEICLPQDIDDYNSPMLNRNTVKFQLRKPNSTIKDLSGPDTDEEDVQVNEIIDRQPLNKRYKAKPLLHKNKTIFSTLKQLENVSDHEDIPCSENDLMNMNDFFHACRNDFDLDTFGGSASITSMQVAQFKENNSTNLDGAQEGSEDLSIACSNDDENEEDIKTEIERVQDNTVTLDQFYNSVKSKKPQFMPIIRLVEVEGVDGAIGVICPDPRSPTTDKVFGIQFNEPDDRTEEFSDISDALHQDLGEEEAQARVATPSTEDEEMSGHGLDDQFSRMPKMRLEYYIPSPRKKIVSLKEHNCGTIRKVEELLDPNEALSLNEFMLEQNSEVDVLHMTDEEIEELPKDKEVKKNSNTASAKSKKYEAEGANKKTQENSSKNSFGAKVTPEASSQQKGGTGTKTNNRTSGNPGKKRHRKRGAGKKQSLQ